MEIDKRSYQYTIEYLKTMRRRGHGRAEMISMLDTAEAEVAGMKPTITFKKVSPVE